MKKSEEGRKRRGIMDTGLSGKKPEDVSGKKCGVVSNNTGIKDPNVLHASPAVSSTEDDQRKKPQE